MFMNGRFCLRENFLLVFSKCKVWNWTKTILVFVRRHYNTKNAMEVPICSDYFDKNRILSASGTAYL